MRDLDSYRRDIKDALLTPMNQGSAVESSLMKSTKALFFELMGQGDKGSRLYNTQNGGIYVWVKIFCTAESLR